MRAKQRSVAEPSNIKMAYQQAQIAVAKAEEFEQLKSALDRILGSGMVETFYRKLQSRTVNVRELEKIVAMGILEAVDSTLAKVGKTAQALYGVLTLSDQALMREFYLERIEKVDVKIREKFRKVYQYY